MQNWGEAHIFYLAREVGKFEDFLAEKKVTLSWLMNSDMVKPEKSDHLHLFYHFTVPLSIVQIYWKYTSKVYLKYTASILKAYFKYTSSILQPVELQKKYTSSNISKKGVHLKYILWD